MKKILPACLRTLVFSVALLLTHASSFASHIVGCDLFYTWISGNTYKVTVVLYGNCSPASSAAYGTLYYAAPQVCVYDGATLSSTLNLAVVAPIHGVEITPVCPSDSLLTQCHVSSSTIPGITKFVYTANVTLPHASRHWRFVYDGNNGTASASGRAADITNLSGPGSTIMQLIDTLNNIDTGIYSHNTSPDLTVIPTPFFCENSLDCYNPGAVDPDGDSLIFALVAPGNGTEACGSVGGVCSYTGNAWTAPTYGTVTQPVTAVTPITCYQATYLFDPTTGQICFDPYALQRSVVVYNIEEYRNDTLVGTCQREMTFVVLACPNPAPTSGLAGLSGLILDDTTHYHACGNSGAFCVTYNVSEVDTSGNLITLSVTGLAPGMTYTVTGNGTTAPSVTICGNTDSLTPGLYSFFVHMQDNACPLVGSNTEAYSINLYPVPTLRDSIAFPATCFNKAVVYIIPGGTGKPWTIDVSGDGGLDTFQTFIDSVTFIDSLSPIGPGINAIDTISIFTDVSHECSVWLPITIIAPPPIDPTVTFTNPTYCGAKDGTITLHGLETGITDSVKYQYNGVWVTTFPATVSGDSIWIPGLLAGTYDSIFVWYGFCHSPYMGPYVLVNPPFPIRTLSYVEPTRCGECDASINVYGLNPGQLDTVVFTKNSTIDTISYYVGLDSMILFSGLCDDTSYTNIYVYTDGVCSTSHLAGVTLHGPTLNDNFVDTIHYGCHGDTVYFTNYNTSDSDHSLTYHWYFGDGYTDTAQDPYHIYMNTATDTTFNVKLYATNVQYLVGTGPGCTDSLFAAINLVNYISPSYTFTPSPFVCQNTPITFTNTSISLNPVDSPATKYLWLFGNSSTSTAFSPSYTYQKTGNYNVTLIETNFVPCSDTIIQSLIVDTISGIQMLATDTTLCSGQEVTFTGLYASEGFVGNAWGVSDGFAMNNVNPVFHSFDGAGNYVVTVTAMYRACPETTATRSIRVYGYPDIYLGPDTSICLGSNSIILTDIRNQSNPLAKWIWNTGDSSSQITVVKPGYYSASVSINGCSAADTVWVQDDCYLDLPNVFTPNGDGVNDYFYPMQLLARGAITFSMNIYNRWGQLVFQTTSIDGRGWDGNFNNIPQPTGVYVYLIDATFKDGQIAHRQGNITLLR